MATENYRILCLFPVPASSHTTVFFALVDALADRGHELVVATLFPKANSRPNVKYIDWSAAEKPWKKMQGIMTTKMKSKMGLVNNMKLMGEVFEETFEQQIAHPEIQQLLRNPTKQKFDLVICESAIHQWFTFADIFQTPLIAISSSDPNKAEHEAVGNVVHYVAAPIRWAAMETPGFAKRMSSVFFDWLFSLLALRYLPMDKLSKRHFGAYFKTSKELLQRIDMLFINVHPVTGIIRPLVPKTIPLGFVHVKPAKPLPENLKQYLNASQHGVIYCSLGTQVRTSSMGDTFKKLMNAFGKLKYDVIFKSDTNTVDGAPDNVRVETWLPQNDLLAHKNLKLFITQAGQHSMEEAIYHGVPLLALPFFGDQPLNGRRIAEKGIGEWLDHAKATVEVLCATIEKIIGNQLYKQNVEELQKVVQDQPMSSLEKAVWWTEYTVRHRGAKHLAYPGVKVPAYQLYYLDVMAAYFIIIIALFTGLSWIGCLICSTFLSG